MNDDQVYYAALVDRDPSYEGVFWYGVRTTGVYCRPTCKSRQPLARNISYYPSPAAARADGFRPCKRCKPDTLPEARPPWIDRACALLDAGEERITLDALAAELSVGRSHLQRTFTRAVGVSPRRYAAAVRERRLRADLRDGASVTTATYSSGFGSSSRVYENARLGMTPGRYRAGAHDTTIFYAIVPSALGLVLVAASERGIAFVALGDREAPLEAELRAEFPHATLARIEDRLESATSALVRYLAGEGPWPRLPLDVRATAFQSRVWDALQCIAPGTTTTYSDLARALGDPRATRAVARACATNPVSLLIPCHRVMAVDGHLRGYRWGLDRKRRLIELEQKSA